MSDICLLFYVDVYCVHYKFVQLIIRLAFYCTFLYFLATCRIAATNVIEWGVCMLHLFLLVVGSGPILTEVLEDWL